MSYAAEISPCLRMLLKEGKSLPFVVFRPFSEEKQDCKKLQDAFPQCPPILPFTCVEDFYKSLPEFIKTFQNTYKTAPVALAVDSVGLFFTGQTKEEADSMAEAFLKDGEPTITSKATGRLAGKIAIVTGAAQGFGLGIAKGLLEEGASCIIADLNLPLAEKTAEEFSATFGKGRAIALSVDVSNEESVESLINETVLHYGGLDLFVSNAGVLKAGGLEEMNLKDFNFVTNINYNAFFLCAKYASRLFKLQQCFDATYMSDIIQINSKSGLVGSNKNFAYAGSKFGGIGLVQSFAMELAEFGVKVNAICPGNYYEGPLWKDPERGLFVQYLKAGKVKGAKTVEDVQRFYEEKVPLGRGCFPEDVVLAILYLVAQRYETGQALPVTGGQSMLH